MKKMMASDWGIHGRDAQGQLLGRCLGNFLILEAATPLLLADAQGDSGCLRVVTTKYIPAEWSLYPFSTKLCAPSLHTAPK